MKIGHLYINTNEINYFTVERLTSLEIRIDIFFKNGEKVWTRTNDDEINELTANLLRANKT
jgi:hypothetical protein